MDGTKSISSNRLDYAVIIPKKAIYACLEIIYASKISIQRIYNN